MLNLPLKGIIPPIVTPLLDNSTIDIPGLENLIEHYVSGGLHGLFVLGTTGEAQSLTYSVRKEFISRTVQLVNHRIPVLVGITDTSFEDSLEMANYSYKAGADAVVVAPPYYIPISEGELLEYFETLIPLSPLPLLLYNMPSHTKLHMSVKTVRAARELGAVGIKDSSGDLMYLLDLIEEFRDAPEFSIFAGTELYIPETIMRGGHGAIAGGANIYPRFYVDFYDASLKGDLDKIEKMRTQVLKLYHTIYAVGQTDSKYTRGIKCALSAMGLCSDYVANPLRKMEGAQLQQIEQYLEEFSLTGSYK